MESRRALLPALTFLLGTAACGPAVTIQRLSPAPYNLGSVTRLVLEADGPSRHETELVRARFVEKVDAQQAFRLEERVTPGADDVVVRLRVTEVESFRRNKVEKKKDKEGKEYEKKRFWADGVCTFQVTLLDGADGRLIGRFTASHEASSPIYDEWRDSLLRDAEKTAVDGAVDEALGQFTPRRVTDRLELDEKAPKAAEGIAHIKQGRLEIARQLWAAAMKESPTAGLAYNLGCVSEAIGDPEAASGWYAEAMRLNPAEARRGAERLRIRE